MLAFVIELVAEFLLQFVLEVAVELGLHAARVMAREDAQVHPALAVVGYVIVGAGLGWLSLLIFPERIVANAPLPGVSLVVAPVLAGLGMSAIGWLRRRNDGRVIRLDRFSYGFLFAFTIAVVRFVFTSP